MGRKRNEANRESVKQRLAGCNVEVGRGQLRQSQKRDTLRQFRTTEKLVDRGSYIDYSESNRRRTVEASSTHNCR